MNRSALASAAPYALLILVALTSACQPAKDHDDASHREDDGHAHEAPASTPKPAPSAHKEGEGDAHKEGEADDHHDEADERGVALSPEALKRAAIEVAPAQQGTLATALSLPAEVQFNPDKLAHVSPLVQGQLISVEATLGDRVKAGQALARLRSVELGQARAELSRTTALRKLATQTLTRQQKLRAEGISAARSLLEAQLAYDQADAERDAALSKLRVFGVSGGSGAEMSLESPIDGVIVERHATRGESVNMDDTLFTVADLSRVWVMGRVYEQQVAQVSPGMTAHLSLNAYPSRQWTGKVDFVGSVINEATRTLPIRVELDNPDGALKPGLFGALRVVHDATAAAQQPSLLIPSSAIQTMSGLGAAGEQTVVFVPDEDHEGRFIATPVTIGRQSAQQVEVLGGLKPDAKIVVKGAFILKSELMRGQLGHGHAH